NRKQNQKLPKPMLLLLLAFSIGPMSCPCSRTILVARRRLFPTSTCQSTPEVLSVLTGSFNDMIAARVWNRGFSACPETTLLDYTKGREIACPHGTFVVF